MCYQQYGKGKHCMYCQMNIWLLKLLTRSIKQICLMQDSHSGDLTPPTWDAISSKFNIYRICTNGWNPFFVNSCFYLHTTDLIFFCLWTLRMNVTLERYVKIILHFFISSISYCFKHIWFCFHYSTYKDQMPNERKLFFVKSSNFFTVCIKL